MFSLTLRRPYALAEGFQDVAFIASCPINVDSCAHPSPFSWDAAGAKLTYMLLSIPLWFIVIQIIENQLAPSTRRDSYSSYRPMENSAVDVVKEDEDVRSEASRVDTLQGSDKAGIIATHLRKVFPSKPEPKVAVYDLSFGVDTNHCLGLLGCVVNTSFVSLCLCVSVSLCLCVSVFVSLFLCPCVYVCVSVYLTAHLVCTLRCLMSFCLFRCAARTEVRLLDEV